MIANNILFYLAAAIAVLTTGMVVISRNAVYAVLYLIMSLFAVALVFVTLNAPFLALVEKARSFNETKARALIADRNYQDLDQMVEPHRQDGAPGGHDREQDAECETLPSRRKPVRQENKGGHVGRRACAESAKRDGEGECVEITDMRGGQIRKAGEQATCYHHQPGRDMIEQPSRGRHGQGHGNHEHGGNARRLFMAASECVDDGQRENTECIDRESEDHAHDNAKTPNKHPGCSRIRIDDARDHLTLNPCSLSPESSLKH